MINHELLRVKVLLAAREGRATELPAGARDNATALIFIDGELVGQSSTVGHYVTTKPDAPMFGESLLIPIPSHFLPRHLR